MSLLKQKNNVNETLKKKGKFRFQVELDEEMESKLEKLSNELKFASNRELFINLYNYLIWGLEKKKKGLKVGAFNDKTNVFSELLFMPFEIVDKSE